MPIAQKYPILWADDIVAQLSGGLPGIAQTRIAYVNAKSGNKEIWTMDYDGQNQHQLTHLKSISLTPRWAPSADRIAFTCYVPFRGVTRPEICLFSTISDRLISFPRYVGSNSSPAWSPDGNQIAFMSSQNGDPEIYLTDANGGGLKRITFAAGVSTSPAWNPKTGKQIVFVSDRGGEPVLYLANSDGTDCRSSGNTSPGPSSSTSRSGNSSAPKRSVASSSISSNRSSRCLVRGAV
jgi:TolB protein